MSLVVIVKDEIHVALEELNPWVCFKRSNENYVSSF
jgi:hypothetical protein